MHATESAASEVDGSVSILRIQPEDHTSVSVASVKAHASASGNCTINLLVKTQLCFLMEAVFSLRHGCAVRLGIDVSTCSQQFHVIEIAMRSAG